MKKFSLISESNRPDIEELESYFDFIKDFDFCIRAEIGRNLDHIVSERDISSLFE